MTGPYPAELSYSFKQWSSHQFIVARDREESLGWELNQEQSLVLLGPGAVGGDVGVLWGLKVGSPPVGHHIPNHPLCLHL